ncbi:MAG: hypothetical protein P3B98_10130 [Gemmatimonadota bacterium]|nr:hypothetical protein [Gemmatimonadota bacterium]
MRRRSLLHRWSAALVGSWFVLTSVAPSSWRPCPTHALGEVVAHGEVHWSAAAGRAEQQPAVSMDCHQAPADAASAPPTVPGPPNEPAPHPCDCPPGCSTVPVVAKLDRIAIVASPSERFVEPVPTAPVARVGAERPRLLPFANGPPLG